MQTNSMASKRRVIIDGREMTNVVSVGEIKFEKNTIEVPTPNRIKKIASGIITEPTITIKFETPRSQSDTSKSDDAKFLQEWFESGDSHDLTIVYVDAAGTQFDKLFLYSCEVASYQDAPFDAGNVTYAAVDVEILPYDHKWE